MRTHALELNPALYNQRCKHLKDGVEVDIFNKHEASEAGRIYRAKRRRLSDYGYSFRRRTEQGFAADVMCDPQDSERKFGQDVRDAMQKTEMAITAEEQMRKEQEYKECQKQALKRYDAEPDANARQGRLRPIRQGSLRPVLPGPSHRRSWASFPRSMGRTR